MENRFFRFKRLKAQAKLFAPILFLLAALGFLVFLTRETPVVAALRTHTLSVVMPVVTVLTSPIEWVEKISRGIGQVLLVYRENDRLRLENKELYLWKNEAFRLTRENEQLSKLLNVKTRKVKQKMTVAVLADPDTPFSKTKIISAGATDGVKKGMLAFSDKALVGRVVEVGADYARVLMLFDYLSRVPVRVGKERFPAILSGDNSALPELVLLPEGAAIEKGDRVVSSGDAGVYPAELFIGQVFSANDDGVRVTLADERQDHTHLILLDFGLDKALLPDEEMCRKCLPTTP